MTVKESWNKAEDREERKKKKCFHFPHPVRLKLFFIILQILNVVPETNVNSQERRNSQEGNGIGVKQE